jgi:hypothetical protein
MALRLNVGVSRKVGLPDYGSMGASCNLELELDPSLIDRDVDALQGRIRDAYAAAQRAVQSELERLQTNGDARRASSRAANGKHPADNERPTWPSAHRPIRIRRMSTPGQIRALVSIASSVGLDLPALLREEYRIERPDELSIGEASKLIDRLKSEAVS